jgi:L-lactate dehydrogenase complex protein LldE
MSAPSVSLFVTCLVDQVAPEVGAASLRVLRRAGCQVGFERDQTCCGQPAANSGYRREARAVAQRQIEVYERCTADYVVLPSGSCTAQFRHNPDLFAPDDPWHARALALAERVHDLASFLVRVLGVTDLGARFEGRLTWHDACHGLRDLGLHSEPRALLSKVQGLELVEATSSQVCCGFGGTFSVEHPELSVAMCDDKLMAVEALQVDGIVSGDVSCLMQLGGRLKARGSKLRTIHLAEVLASR